MRCCRSRRPGITAQSSHCRAADRCRKAHADIAAAPVEGARFRSGNVLSLWRWLRRGAAGRMARRGGFAAAAQPDAVARARRRGAAAVPASCAAVLGRPSSPDRAGGRRSSSMIGRQRASSRSSPAGFVAIGRWTAGWRSLSPARRGADQTRPVCVRHQLHRAAGSHCAHAGSNVAQLLRWSWCARPTRHRARCRRAFASQRAERLWALGPLTKGRYWEIVAVPDIRGQAAAVADDIARELGR